MNTDLVITLFSYLLFVIYLFELIIHLILSL